MDDELKQYLDMWDNAQTTGEFDIKKEVIPDDPTDSGECDDFYWKNMELIHEVKGKTPNPVYPDSLDKDYKRPKTKKSTAALKKIDKLKRKLYELECDLLGKEAGGNKWVVEPKELFDDQENGNLDKITKLKDELNILSNELGFGDETAQSVYDYTDEEVS